MIAAMLSAEGVNRDVLRACFGREGSASHWRATVFLEYEEVLARPRPMARSPLSAAEQRKLLEAFLSICEWVDVYFGWRPN